MNRREFTPTVRRQIIDRATVADKITCEGCGLVLGPKVWHIDHTTPDELATDKSRPLTADDGKLLGWDCCHKPKTAVDQGVIAKAKRRQRRHRGDRPPSKWPTGRDGPWKKKISGEVVSR